MLKLDFELLNKVEQLKFSPCLFLSLTNPFEYNKKSIHPSLDKYFIHGISSSHSRNMKSFKTSFPFLTYVLAVKQYCMPKRLSAPLVCGFLSKLAEPYGKKLHLSAGNKPVKHITSSYSVSF